MNDGRLRSWGLTASLLLASNVAYAAHTAKASQANDNDDKVAQTDEGADEEEAVPARGKVGKSETKLAPKASEEPPPGAEVAGAAPLGASTTAPPAAAAALPPVTSRWNARMYGFVELDGMHDSTQSFGDASNGANVARRGTYAGDRGQTQSTIKNSRLGFKLIAPEYMSVRMSGQLEMDFFGLQPTDAKENDFFVQPNLRLRLAFMKFETPVIDVLAGQYHDLFGWGGAGFYPNTVAFLGVPGQIYHRNPQVRFSKVVGDTVQFEIAAAAVRPAQRHSEVPDVQAGLRLAFNNWRGVSSQGSGQPQVAPLGLGVSAIGRKFVIPQFIGQPRNANTAWAGGVAANAVLPVIPAKSIEDRGNSLTLTGEFSTGTGIADLYSGMTAGARFPELPNPGGDMPPFLYPQDVDAGLVTYDADKQAKTYQWTAVVAGLQYYLPVANGNVWISGIYSQLASNNIVRLTPVPSLGAVYKFARYWDANIFWAVTPSAQLGASFQYTQQIYGDNELVQASGLVGPSAKPFNMRAEGSATFFF